MFFLLNKYLARTGALLAAAAISTLFSPLSAVGKEQAPYKFMIPVLSELKFDMLPQLIMGVSEAIEKKTGKKAEPMTLTYDYGENPVAAILDKMNEGSIDFAMVYPAEYHLYLLEKPSNAVPFLGIEMFGKLDTDMCLYTRKGDNITNIKQVKGKNWGGLRTRNARYLLAELGYDGPLSDYFGKMTFIPDWDANVLIKKLTAGEIDAVTLPDAQLKLARAANPDLDKAVHAGPCKKYLHNWLAVARKDIPKKDVDQITEIFLGFHKDPDFLGYRYLLKFVEGKFVEVNYLDLYPGMIHAMRAKRGKWMEEENAFIKANYKKEEKSE